jgi:hypothetical protein
MHSIPSTIRAPLMQMNCWHSAADGSRRRDCCRLAPNNSLRLRLYLRADGGFHSYGSHCCIVMASQKAAYDVYRGLPDFRKWRRLGCSVRKSLSARSSLSVDFLFEFFQASDYRIEGERFAIKHTVGNHFVVVQVEGIPKRMVWD